MLIFLISLSLISNDNANIRLIFELTKYLSNFFLLKYVIKLIWIFIYKIFYIIWHRTYQKIILKI
nr:MAG TPA: hypothetical protein [Bacteriophage sp.]